jgi:hypothetical protein
MNGPGLLYKDGGGCKHQEENQRCAQSDGQEGVLCRGRDACPDICGMVCIEDCAYTMAG